MGTSMKDTERVSGRHIKLLEDQFNYYELQHLLGLYMAKIGQAISPKNIDQPVEDVTRALVIRYLLEFPHKANLLKYSTYSDLTNRLESAKSSFPLPTKKSSSGVIFGRSLSTQGSLEKGRKEMQVILTWLTIFINQFKDIEKLGKKHFLYKIMEDEAISRGLTLQDIIYNRGWPKNSNRDSSHDKNRITGEHIILLMEQFDYYDLQFLLGLYVAKLSQIVSKKNVHFPVEDVTRSFIIRVLLEKPELAPLPPLSCFADLTSTVKEMPLANFPLKTNQSNLGALLGRSISTVNGLLKGRKEMRVISIWIDILLDNLEGLNEQGKDHPIYRMMEAEANSRGVTLQSIEYNRGWPKI